MLKIIFGINCKLLSFFAYLGLNLILNIMGDRPRIKKEEIKETGVIEDALEYKKNRSSENARKHIDKTHNIEISIWYDKHYQIRRTLGDDNGRREGIEEEKIFSLVTKSIKETVRFGLILNNFAFYQKEKTIDSKQRRIVLREIDPVSEILHVVIEGHYIGENSYEITIITAMRIDSFNIKEGQFVIEYSDNIPTLKRNERGSLKIVCE